MVDTQSDAQETLLVEGYDSDQVHMMTERVILVDTADEVLALVREMEERLSGEWIGNSEDHLLQERFKAVFPEDNCMRDFPGYAGSGFLRNNQYLL